MGAVDPAAKFQMHIIAAPKALKHVRIAMVQVPHLTWHPQQLRYLGSLPSKGYWTIGTRAVGTGAVGMWALGKASEVSGIFATDLDWKEYIYN